MFLLTEQIMNGTVTMEIISTAINTETFQQAIEKIKLLPNFDKAIITQKTDKMFTYYMKGEFPCYGKMENKQIKII